MVDSHRHPVLIAHQRKMALSRIQSLKIGLIIVLFPLASLSCRKHAPGSPPEEKKSAGLPGKTVVHARLESMAEVPNPLITPYPDCLVTGKFRKLGMQRGKLDGEIFLATF